MTVEAFKKQFKKDIKKGDIFELDEDNIGFGTLWTMQDGIPTKHFFQWMTKTKKWEWVGSKC